MRKEIFNKMEELGWKLENFEKVFNYHKKQLENNQASEETCEFMSDFIFAIEEIEKNKSLIEMKNELYGLEHERFNSIKDLRKRVQEIVPNSEIGFNQSWKNSEYDYYDFLIVGTIETDDFMWDIDIYYTKSKIHYFITEINIDEA